MTEHNIKQMKKIVIIRNKITRKIDKVQLMLHVTLILIYSRVFSANFSCNIRYTSEIWKCNFAQVVTVFKSNFEFIRF